MQLPEELRTVPNAISATRALAGPVVMMLLISGSQAALIAALAVMVLAEFSDMADGAIARSLGQETELGSLVDPVCDSIYHLSVFLGLLANGWIPVWMLFAIFAGDLTVPYLTTFARQVGQTLKVRLSGSLKSGIHGVCQIGIVAVAAGLAGDALPSENAIFLLAGVAMAISILLLIDHGVEASRITAK